MITVGRQFLEAVSRFPFCTLIDRGVASPGLQIFSFITLPFVISYDLLGWAKELKSSKFRWGQCVLVMRAINRIVNKHFSRAYATCTSPIMHLIFAPQNFHNLCFSFLLGITAVPREIGNNAYAKFFWGKKGALWVTCKWCMWKWNSDWQCIIITKSPWQ